MTDESSKQPSKRHALTAVERQRLQLEKLLKDPVKQVYIPTPPKEKTIRPAREMMKNVQGSSAGAGSGEFHVYKASRRREYERLKLLDEAAQKEADAAEFERKRREAEEAANSKTSKNRAKRQKKKERAKTKPSASQAPSGETGGDSLPDVPIKKRRLINGKELVFNRHGENSEDEEGDQDVGPEPGPLQPVSSDKVDHISNVQPSAEARLIIHEDD